MKQPVIFVVSDSVGETAEVFAKAAVSQFPDRNFIMNRKSHIDDLAKIDEVIEEAKALDAVIVYTLIKEEMCAYLELRAKELGLCTHNLFGGFIETIERKYDTSAAQEFGLTHRLDEDYYRKIEAIDFAVKHDDGREPSGALKADIVLLGISRTSKTPLSQSLAHKGYYVVNIPIVPEVNPPEELFQIDSAKCIGLTSSMEKIRCIRKERLKVLGLDDNAIYASSKRIEEELAYFNDIIQRLNCNVVDVSDRAIEETAHYIDQMMQEKS